MTPEQRKLARHALGLDGRRKMSYRNRFYATVGSADHGDWTAMVKADLADVTRDTMNSRMDFFWLTRKGAEAALNRGEKLDPEDFPRAIRKRHNLTPEQEAAYIDFDPFLDCDRDAEPMDKRVVRIVRTAYQQKCVTPTNEHLIPKGTLARYEKAYWGGRNTPGQYWTCLACCDLIMKHPDPETRPKEPHA